MNNKLIKKLINYQNTHNGEYPKCIVCEKEIVPVTSFEYVKQKSGNEIFIHTVCFEQRFLGK